MNHCLLFLSVLFLGGLAFAGSEKMVLGEGRHVFVDQAFVGQCIEVEGLRFVDQESTEVRFVGCTFSNSIIRAREAVLFFEACSFIDTPETVLLATACHATVTGCTFERTAEAINLIRSTGHIVDSRFRHIWFGADAIDIDFDPDVPNWTPVRVEGNVIDQCSGDGIDLGACQSDVISNRVFNCADKGISVGEGSSGELRGNLVQNARIGIAIKDGSNPQVIGNTVTHCRFGIRSYEKLNGSGGAYGDCQGNRFFACEQPFTADLRSFPYEQDRVMLTAFTNTVTLFTNSPPVVINEVAHRAPTGSFEYVELHNPTETAIDMSGWSLVDEAFHLFETGTLIPPLGFHVVRFPYGSLADDVLVIRLVDQHQTDVDTVEIIPYRKWPVGNQPLELLDPDVENNEGQNWENAVSEFGSPGSANSRRQRIVESWSFVPVSISEIMYHPPNEADEYVELHNWGPIPIDISGWYFSDGIRDFVPFGTVLDSGGFFVLHGPFQDGRLSNRGERLDLRDAQGLLVDRVDYLDRGEWPRQADGEGAALERRSFSVSNNRPNEWVASPGSPGEPNAFTNHAAVSIFALAHWPVQPDPGEVIEIRVRSDGVPTLEWRVDPDLTWTRETMDRVSVATDSNCWVASLQPQLHDSLVVYRVVAADGDGLELTSPSQLLRVSEQDMRPDLDLLVTKAHVDELLSRPLSSDDLLPCTLVAGRQIFQRARLRYRGQTKRVWPAKSYRVDLRDAHPFENEDRLNLNGKRPISEALAYQVFHRFGFRSPRIRLVSARVGGSAIMPLSLTQRDYPDPASQGWPVDFDHKALVQELNSPDIDSLIDMENWIDWFALTALVGDSESLLDGVNVNHAVEGFPDQPMRLQPLDLDIAFASQAPRMDQFINPSRLIPWMSPYATHPEDPRPVNLPRSFLIESEILNVYFDRLLGFMDELLLDDSFIHAADTIYANQPFSFLDTRGLLDVYLATDFPAIEADIRKLLFFAPAPTTSTNLIHLPYPDSWIVGETRFPSEIVVDGQAMGRFTNEWSVDVTLTTPTQELVITSWPLSNREWAFGTNRVTLIYDASDLDQNGLPTSWERAFGVDDPAGDADGDGLSNLREFELRSDPLADSRIPLTMVRTSTGGLALQWPDVGTGNVQRGFSWLPAGPAIGGQRELDTSAPLHVYRLQFPEQIGILPLSKP